ncbi:MAG: hypothetical protein AB3N06_11205 [Erythrobacter sp.]
MTETHRRPDAAPAVRLWETWGLRLIFLAIAVVLGTKQWSYILEGTGDWTAWRGLGHAMLATLALLAIAGVFHPLKLLPLMLFEIAWKTVWLLVVALPAWLGGSEVPGIVSIWGSVIGIGVVTILIPWRYVWWCYVTQPIEPWRPGTAAPDRYIG